MYRLRMSKHILRGPNGVGAKVQSSGEYLDARHSVFRCKTSQLLQINNTGRDHCSWC